MNYKKYLLLFILPFSFSLLAQTPIENFWLGKLKLNDSTRLFFDFEWNAINGKVFIVIHNAEERITVDEINDTKDSLNFKMPVFDSEFKCKKSGDSLVGLWVNHSRKTNNVIPFSATKKIYGNTKNNHTFEYSPFKGKWEITFNCATADEYKGMGLFQQPNKNTQQISGTILTETGDYRYLNDVLQEDNTFYLSCFDGAHAFLFKAKQKADGTLKGDFWSGTHGHEKWIAKRNEKFELTNPDSLTYLKPGYNKIEFSFPDLNNKNISLTDKKYNNKVVIVQIMGSWCPNCMDETKFLSALYEKHKSQGLEVIALAYERTGTLEQAVKNVDRLKKKLNCNYDVLIAALTSDRIEAAKTLPMLNQIMSFPTTIYIDKKEKVRKIYTGYNGPATGKYYDKYVEGTNFFIKKLLAE